MTLDRSLPALNLAEVRITAASPEVARQVALVLRARFAGSEQRSYPAGDSGSGTRLHLTVDTARPAELSDGLLQWPVHAPSEGRLS